ncbi:DUF1963 domain-containing protein [Novosphingobium sp.]|uniref:DUF1963 domain-containing protein n=2 Tax=Novosphingobium sp. TaxID=1874826 RepID=UPI002FDA0850
MKRILTMLPVFGLAALAAVYVALAPHAPFIASPGIRGALTPLDSAAAHLIAIRGRSVAVVGLLTVGVVLSALTAMMFGRAGAQAGMTKRPSSVEADAAPVRPRAPSPSDRIANLRRRAASAIEQEPSPDTPAAVTPPVILVRKPRERERDWFSDRSWFGGLPRLGEAEWPRDAGGSPLPFAAQLDLEEIAAACPESPLPRAGSLAFFLGTGAVIAVTGEGEFSDPPQDLPAAYDEGGYPFPAVPSYFSRHFFPFWPVEPNALDVPNHFADPNDALERAMASFRSRYTLSQPGPFTADGDVLWWHGVSHLADQLHVALESSSRLMALKQDGVRRAEDLLAALANKDVPDDPAAAQAHTDLATRQTDLAATEAQREGLPTMIAALDQFVSGRDPWQELTDDERSLVKDVLTELHAGYGELVLHHVPRTTADLAALSLRAMVTGAPDAVAAMAERQLQRINREYRLPATHQHQIFSLAGLTQSTDDERGNDILLLQLGYDEMMEWRWNDMGMFQFWISAENAAAGNWSAVHLTFERG